MSGNVKAVPEGYHTLTPVLVVRDAPRAIEFYKQAFGAGEGMIMYGPDGKSIMHAELIFGDSILMLGEESPTMNALSPQSVGGSSVTMHMYVEDVDGAFRRAISAGAVETMPLMDAFWGDRYGRLTDPFGHQWALAMRIKALSKKEMEEAAKVFFAQPQT